MKISRFSLGAGALAAAGLLVLSGCATGGGTGSNGSIISVNGTEPQNPLIPTSTNEVGGGRIIDVLFAGLVYYDAEGTPHNEVAESIESDDATTYTIKINDNWTFTNGESVTAQSFVDAWNFGALSTNTQLNASWFSDIAGYDAVSATVNAPDGALDDEGEPVQVPAPTAETLSGLKVVSDTEFTVELSGPHSDFPLRLGYSAFFPLPQAAYKDMEAFGQNPIGNGPYKMSGEGAWNHNVGASVVVNEDYEGGRKPVNDGIDFTFYESLDAAYQDLQADNLDVLDTIPASALEVFQDDLNGRSVNKASALFQAFAIPQTVAHFAGEEGQLRRAALSHAINRDQITSVLFAETRTPAEDYSSPVVSGWSDSIPGNEVLEYNVDLAKQLWAQADAIAPWSGTFEIAYNADGGHQVWVDAVANNFKNNLGIEAQGRPYAQFSELRKDIVNRSISTAFRNGWQADYPAISNFLEPVFLPGGSGNDTDYNNPEFNAAIAAAAAEPDIKKSTEMYNAAQTILFQDLPSIPLWYQNATGGWSTAVENVEFGWNSVPLYHEITKG
ncbi:ABC transporter substrate-binding protein [Lysinibacter sp. HNR]|uniref:peptide ABC transporter substrate-binding protein n=1 Tax=Lysinibacter sp. HNR TaxID=3031408 RepID=UPI002435E0C2|nr:ABC transporter substrate-binding protein [Lysinibacter sp. HNR]WGD38354.1 ABC transporter substrate-binding protein [Lysinibacter sp. HNR]